MKEGRKKQAALTSLNFYPSSRITARTTNLMEKSTNCATS